MFANCTHVQNMHELAINSIRLSSVGSAFHYLFATLLPLKIALFFRFSPVCLCNRFILAGDRATKCTREYSTSHVAAVSELVKLMW